MTLYVIAIALAAVVAVFALFTRSLMADITAGLNKDRAHRAHERELHGEQVARLVHDFAEERRHVGDQHAAERERWDAERSVLLNRIQDPIAGVASSLAYLPPPNTEPGGLDMEHQR